MNVIVTTQLRGLTDQLNGTTPPSAFSRFIVYNENVNDPRHILFIKFEHPRGHLKKLHDSHHVNVCRLCQMVIQSRVPRFVLYNANNTPSAYWCMDCAVSDSFMESVVESLPEYRGHNQTRKTGKKK
jgi:hypothetical protein